MSHQSYYSLLDIYNIDDLNTKNFFKRNCEKEFDDFA